MVGYNVAIIYFVTELWYIRIPEFSTPFMHLIKIPRLPILVPPFWKLHIDASLTVKKGDEKIEKMINGKFTGLLALSA